MKKIFIIAILTATHQCIVAQSVGIGTNTPSSSAQLEVASTTKGMLIPRMTTAQRTVIVSPVKGLLVFDNSSNTFWFYNGTAWEELAAGSSNGWTTTGNAGMVDGTNFIGTTTNVPLNFRQNNVAVGRLDAARNSVYFGELTGGGTETANNTFIGDHAGFAHFGVGIGNNTFIGSQAGYSNTTATENTYLGANAGYDNTLSTGNTMIGFNAGNNNTAGNNTFIGHNSGAQNTTGTDNVFVGKEAGYNNKAGINNVYIGKFSGKLSTTGAYNTVVGKDAFYFNTSGDYNTANGYQALYQNTTGEANSAHGMIALWANTSGSDNTATGSGALQDNTVGSGNTATGFNALNLNTSGSHNTAVGFVALSNVGTGSNNTGIGYNAIVPNSSGNNQVRIGNFEVIYAGVEVAWTITSDKRAKSNIRSSTLGLNFINALNPVSYYRNNDEKKRTEYGLIAQELEAALNKFGESNNGIITIDDKGMYSVRYNDLIAPMIKAIQEQQKMIEDLQKINTGLTSRLEAIEINEQFTKY